jgi:hypothetical protein
MVYLSPANVGRAQIDVSGEEEGDGQMPPTRELDRDWLSPARQGWAYSHVDLSWIEASRSQLGRNSFPNHGVVLTPLGCDPCAEGGGRLLSDPYVDQPPELDDAEENGQQHEGDCEDRLQRLLPLLSPAPTIAHAVCVSRCTICPIFVTRPLFHAMIPTTSVPRMIAAPITHSRVDCPRSPFLMVSSFREKWISVSGR